MTAVDMQSARLEEFVAAARRALPDSRLDRYRVRSFGRNAALAAELIALIARGEKTGTFSLAAEFEARPEDAPRVGDAYVVTHFDGTPALIYRITETQTLPFTAIAPCHVEVEGPRLRELAAWRRVHRDYWTPMLRSIGRELGDDTPVIFQRFRVLFGAGATDPG